MHRALLLGLTAWLSVAGNSVVGSSLHNQSGQSPNVMAAKASPPWVYQKEDPKTRKRLVLIRANSFEGTSNPSVFKLHGVTGKV